MLSATERLNYLDNLASLKRSGYTVQEALEYLEGEHIDDQYAVDLVAEAYLGHLDR